VLLENSLLPRFRIVLWGGDVFFLLHPVEEREGKDKDDYYAPDVLGFVCRGTSVFAMGCQGTSVFVTKPGCQKDR